MAELGMEKWPLCMAEAKKFVEELKLVRDILSNTKCKYKWSSIH